MSESGLPKRISSLGEETARRQEDTSLLPMRAARAVDSDRLRARLQGLASFGAARPGDIHGGVARQALTPQELLARRWLATEFAGRPGYSVGIDAAANVYIRRHGANANAAPVLTGSHVDTQPLGGWLDGAFGVVAGLEVFAALDAAGLRTERPIETVMWTNEEGSRFAPGLMGSVSYTDPARLAAFRDTTDAQGVSFLQACNDAREDFAMAAREAGWRWFDAPLARPLHAYIEAHIEQGPILEARGLQVGCVTAIQGVRWYRVTVPGRSAHAGTTPDAARDDAQAKAIALAHALLEYGRGQDDDALRLTIGRWQCRPDSINTIADQVVFTVDARHPETRVLDGLEARLHALLPPGAAVDVLQHKPTVGFDPGLVELGRQACKALELRHADMLSGAFHDAMPLAGFCPTAMLFAPSIGGVSHHPGEHTHIDDLAACARALAWCLAGLAQDGDATPADSRNTDSSTPTR
ncbi:N-carbamoyl-L-amino acid hydrolase [Bordetella sputigena]|uniref:M20 family metallo-hydrolase n=1 Tax=Bordetella sputigena TaxID=1416810 RepID=UPI0039F03434